MVRPALVLLVLLGGCAATAGTEATGPSPKQVAAIDRELRGLTPGAPQSCIPLEPDLESHSYSDTILYRRSASEVWRNDTSSGCEGLGRGDTLITKSYTSQLCEGDIVTTVSDTPDRTFTGSCTLGPFVPYRR